MISENRWLEGISQENVSAINRRTLRNLVDPTGSGCGNQVGNRSVTRTRTRSENPWWESPWCQTVRASI
jgi:hypothetical protein